MRTESGASRTFDLSSLNSLTAVLDIGDGVQHVLMLQDQQHLQLCAYGADITEPVALFVDGIVPANSIRPRIQMIEALNILSATGKLPARLFPREPRGARLCTVLQALDGYLAGASQREIAIALFGSDRVRRDWSDPGNHLRDRVRRAIRRGRMLMNGGYIGFLS